MSDSSQSAAEPSISVRAADAKLQDLRRIDQTASSALPELVETLCQKALAARRESDVATAEASYLEALQECSTAPIKVSAHVGFRIYSLLADLLESDDRDHEAGLNYLTALAFAAECKDTTSLQAPIAAIHNSLGMLMVRRSELETAVKHLRLGLDLVEKCDHTETPDLSTELYTTLEENLGEALVLHGDHDAARACFSKALRFYRSQNGEPDGQDAANIQRLLGRLESVFEQLGEYDTAEACAERLES